MVSAALAVASGCAAPAPEPTPADRAREQQQALSEAQARRSAYDASRARAGLAGGPAQPGMDEIKQGLLDEYGMEMTPFQRTALLTAQISSREEGETMCRRWIAENRRFEAGPGAGGD